MPVLKCTGISSLLRIVLQCIPETKVCCCCVQAPSPTMPETRAVLKVLPATETYPGAQFRLAGDRCYTITIPCPHWGAGAAYSGIRKSAVHFL